MQIKRRRGYGRVIVARKTGTVVVDAIHDEEGTGQSVWTVSWALYGPAPRRAGLPVGHHADIIAEGVYYFDGADPAVPDHALFSGLGSAAKAARALVDVVETARRAVYKRRLADPPRPRRRGKVT